MRERVRGGSEDNAPNNSLWVISTHCQDSICFFFSSSKVGVYVSFICARMHAFLVWALSGVLSHVAMFYSVLGGFGQYMSVSCRICPGLEGNGAIMGWLSLML